MRYESVDRNLVDLVSRFSKLSLLQLYEFFRPVCKPEVIYKNAIKHVRKNHMILTDDQYLIWKDSSKFSEYMQEAIEQAFWIVANFGCDKIKEIWVAGFPTVIGFTTTDDEGYDISYITTDIYADRARRKIEADRELRLRTTEIKEDPYYHICVVPYEELGRRYKGHLFDSYCVINKRTHEPKYFTWD